MDFPEVDGSFEAFSASMVLLDVTEHFALSFLAVSAGKGHSETSPQTLSCNCVYWSECVNYLLKLTTVFPVWESERPLHIFLLYW